MTSRRTLLTAASASCVIPGLSFGAGSEKADNYDVIVIGAGAAGLSAATAAAELGARVLLLEKQNSVGGNTRISGGFYAAVDPARQKRLGIEDSFEKFEQQIIQSGQGHGDPRLAKILAYGASEMLAYLEGLGMRFKDELIEIYGAHWRRCHKPAMPNGEGYIRVLYSTALRLGVRILTDTPVIKLLAGQNRVVGVEYEELGQIRRAYCSSGVVCASGGFGANDEMVKRYFPVLAGLSHDNTLGSTGEVLEMAQSVGAQLIDMPLIQCLPGCPPGRTHRVRLHNDVSRFIFVNTDGKRFVREDERRDVLRDCVLALPNRMAYSVVDAEGLRSYDILMQKEAVLGVESGDAWCGDTISELAEKMGVPQRALQESIENYNRGVRTGVDPFGKAKSELKHEIKTPPFWACYAAMTVHYSGLLKSFRLKSASPAKGLVIY